MLMIPDMSERKALFSFMDGLKPWVKIELQRRGVQDLSWAIAVAESLIKFEHTESPKTRRQGGVEMRTVALTTMLMGSPCTTRTSPKRQPRTKARTMRGSPRVATFAMVRIGLASALCVTGLQPSFGRKRSPNARVGMITDTKESQRG